MMNRALILFSFVVAFVSCAHAYSSGAPSFACEKMQPSHGSSPQTGTPPVTVTINPQTYTLGSTVKVTLTSDGEKDRFRGFLLLALAADSVPGNKGPVYGTFIDLPDITKVACPDANRVNRAVTHNHQGAVKPFNSSLTFTWKAPEKFEGDLNPSNVKFWVTIVKEKKTFWKPTSSQEVEYVPPSFPPVSEEGCDVSKHCFRVPDQCKVPECSFFASWNHSGEYIDFELSGDATGDIKYVAIGFSSNGNMPASPTVSCKNINGTIIVESGYNVGYSNAPINPTTDGQDPTKSEGQYDNGRISCRFSYIKSKEDLPPSSNNTLLVADFMKKTYKVLMAKGNINSSGDMKYHGYNNKKASDHSYNFTNPESPETSPAPSMTPTTNAVQTEGPSTEIVSTHTCGTSKSCFRYPSNCESSKCEFIVTWKVNGGYVDFEISATTRMDKQYVAVGFSESGKMSGAPAVNCMYNETEGNVTIATSKNKIPPGNEILSPPTLGLDTSTLSGGYLDGLIICRFSYIRTNNFYSVLGPAGHATLYDHHKKLADLSKLYHLIMAKGHLTDDALAYHHNDRLASDAKLHLDSKDFVNIGGVTIYRLVKAHGCLMTLAWMIFAGIGLIVSRYSKKNWPSTEIGGKNLWFVLHVALVGTAVVLTIIGFILIFVSVGKLSLFTEYPDKVHPFLGIVVTSLAVINPILGVLRCGNDSPHRWIFNWAHRIIGQSAFMGAAANILIAMFMAKSYADAEARWVVIAFIVWHFLTELTLSIINLSVHCEVIEKNSKSLVENVTDEDPRLIRILRTVILVIYSLGVVGCALRVIIPIIIYSS